MRTISANDNALLTSVGGRAAYVRVSVKDAGGTFRDLSTYPGFNAVSVVSWKESIDDPGATADITLKRESEMLSLAPLIATSALNLAFAFPGSYAALLAGGREVKIETSITPADTSPSAWTMVFHGYVDNIDSSADPIHFTARGLYAKIQDTWIERERVYGFVTYDGVHGDSAPQGGVYVWEPNRLYLNDDYVIPTDANRFTSAGIGYAFQTVSGVNDTSLATEPIWPLTPGGSVTDGVTSSLTWMNCATTSTSTGTAVETIIQQILNDNGLSAITLSVPVSPGWNIKWYLQQRQSVWDAIKALADQIGWDLRFMWNGTDFQLTLYQPNRSVSTPQRTFAPSEYYDPTTFATDPANIRNAVQVVYSNSATLDPTGQPLRATVLVTDSTSITANGRRFMEVAEDSASNIDTSVEATTFANAMLADLKDAPIQGEVSVDYFPFVELNDYYRFSPDNIRSTSNTDSAIVGYSNSFQAGNQNPRTTFTFRGKPVARGQSWLDIDGRARPEDVHQLVLNNFANVTITAAQVVGGTQLQITNGARHKRGRPPNTEWHVGTSSGFTASAATLMGSSQSGAISLPHLVPGKSYWARVVPFGWNGQRIVRGQPSQAVAFTGGQAKAAHLLSDVAWGNLPLNGSFETSFDGVQPDYWDFIPGLPGPSKVWGTDALYANDGNGVAGTGYVKLNNARSTTVNVQIQSAFIPIDDKWTQQRLSFWRKAVAGTGGASTFSVGVVFYDVTKAQISSVGTGYDISTNVGTWVKGEIFATPPAGARFMTVGFALASGTTDRVLHVDQLIVTPIGDPWWAIGAGTTMEDGQTVPAFGTNYSNQGGSYMAGAIRKTADGLVEFRGTVKRSANAIGSANPIFTLPAGWRPTAIISVPISGNGQHANLEVDSTGLVYILSGDNATPSTKVTLDAVRFRTW